MVGEKEIRDLNTQGGKVFQCAPRILMSVEFYQKPIEGNKERRCCHRPSISTRLAVLHTTHKRDAQRSRTGVGTQNRAHRSDDCICNQCL